jgi:hypothetical protein
MVMLFVRSVVRLFVLVIWLLVNVVSILENYIIRLVGSLCLLIVKKKRGDWLFAFFVDVDSVEFVCFCES